MKININRHEIGQVTRALNAAKDHIAYLERVNQLQNARLEMFESCMSLFRGRPLQATTMSTDTCSDEEMIIKMILSGSFIMERVSAECDKAVKETDMAKTSTLARDATFTAKTNQANKIDASKYSYQVGAEPKVSITLPPDAFQRAVEGNDFALPADDREVHPGEPVRTTGKVTNAWEEKYGNKHESK